MPQFQQKVNRSAAAGNSGRGSSIDQCTTAGNNRPKPELSFPALFAFGVYQGTPMTDEKVCCVRLDHAVSRCLS